MFFFSQYLQLGRGFSPLQAGLAELPTTIAGVIVGLLLARFGRGRSIAFGLVLAAVGLVLVAVTEDVGPYVWLGLSLIPIGLGIGVAMTLTTDAVVSAVPPEQAGSASAVAETAAVYEALDPADDQPGRLARAYIRASLESGEYVKELRDGVILSAQLAAQPEIAEALAADAERWSADLQADGLPDDVLQLVISASHGGSTAVLWGGEIVGGDNAALWRALIAFTRAPELLSKLVDDGDDR